MTELSASVLENLNQITDSFIILATNSTSGSRISKKSDDVILVALARTGVTLEVPRRSCSRGHSFILQIEANVHDADGEPVRFETQVTGVIEEIEGDLNERFEVRLEFRQYSVDEWQKFLRHVENRQAEANRILGELKK